MAAKYCFLVGLLEFTDWCERDVYKAMKKTHKLSLTCDTMPFQTPGEGPFLYEMVFLYNLYTRVLLKKIP